jgi:hypothetical protein
MDERREPERLECPFLHAVMAEFLWMYPTALYCQPPSRGTKVPSADTLAGICLNGQYRDRCEVYRGCDGEELLRALAW